MNNCLVTKLKETVENESLPKFATLKIKFRSTASVNRAIRLNCENGKSAGFSIVENPSEINIHSVLGNCIKIDDTTGEIHFNDGTSGFVMSGEGFFSAEILNYYWLTILRDVSTFELNSLRYMSRLKNLECITAIGDTSMFKYTPNIAMLYISRNGSGSANNMTGSILDFGNLTSLSLLSITHPGSDFTKKSIEEFVALQRSAGRTEATMTVRLGANAEPYIATFNGENIRGASDKTLAWTPTTITYDGTTIDA